MIKPIVPQKDQQIQRAPSGYIVLEESEYYPQHNVTNSVLRFVLVGVISLGVGCFLFGLGTALVGILVPNPVPVVPVIGRPLPSVSITLARVQQTLHQQVFFEVRSFSVTTTVTLKQDNDDFLWVFPVDQTSVDYHASGIVTVGYDLTQASVIEGEDGNLHVFLPMPTVLDVDVQPELSYFNVDVPVNGSIEPETMTAIISRAEDALEQAAYTRGLVAEGNNSGPQLIGYDLFPGAGNLIFYTQSPVGVSQ